MTSTKESGLGMDFFCNGYHIGSDIQALQIASPMAPIDVTDITQSAHSRLPGLRDASMSLTVYQDPAAGAAHAAFSGLPRTDVIMSTLIGSTIGYPVCCLNALQANYDPTRAADGSLTFKVDGSADGGYGMDWCLGLTPGLRTDTSATSGTSLNNSAASLYGAQAYLQAVSLTGTSGTVTIQHAPDNSTWITLLAFTAVTSSSAPTAQRLATFTGAFTATDASPAVFTCPGSSFSNGTPVSLAALAPGATLPGGFSTATEYFVVSASGTTFELSATSGGSAINSSSAGSGQVFCAVQQYVRAITTGTFSSFAFEVALNRNPVAEVNP